MDFFSNIGSCGLHVIHVHGAFRRAMSETGWDIETEIEKYKQ